MNIAVLGTGMVGQALAGKLSALGNDVTVGTRDVETTLARTEPDVVGNPPFAVWRADCPDIHLATAADAAAGAELIVNATNGEGSIAMLELAGEENLAGKPLSDVSNALDFAQGRPPSLFVSNTDSLGEQIQRRFPEARVVKTLRLACLTHPGPRRHLLRPRHRDVRRPLAPPLGDGRHWVLQHRCASRGVTGECVRQQAARRREAGSTASR
jgi:predicted dinucleotide-binding enzyme